jgi:excinuclease UvrABC ATPase subunit
MVQLNNLVNTGITVVVVEDEIPVVLASNWVIDIGPGAADEGARVVVAGRPSEVARSKESRTFDTCRPGLLVITGATPAVGVRFSRV